MNITSAGTPGYKTPRTATPNDILAQGSQGRYASGYRVIDGSKGRDSGNSDTTTVLRGGMLMGKITSGGKYAPAVIGVSDVAYTSGTSLSLLEATGDEVVRRIGSSGTFKITGPPTAAGTVRTLTATFSAIAAAGSGHRVATITALGASQVDRINFNLASTAGNLQLRVQKPDGTFATTANIAWNATDATYLAAINSALDTTTGVAGSIVATAISAVDPDLGFELTYSNAAAAYPNGATAAQVALFPTTSTAAVYTRITTAVDARFVTGSLIQPNDGSETIRGAMNNPWGALLVDENLTSIDVPLTNLLIGGHVEPTRIPVPGTTYASLDASTASWIKTQLKAIGSFTFTDDAA